MVSFRFKENIFNTAETVIAIIMVILVVLSGYFLVNLYLCLTSDECVSSPTTIESAALLIAFIALAISIILFIITHKHHVHQNRISYRHRKDQIRKQLIGLRNDYLQILHSKENNITAILNQKNNRITMIENIINSSINQFPEKIMEELLILTEKGLRFPMSFKQNNKDNFEKECNMMISFIDEIIETLKKKKWGTL